MMSSCFGSLAAVFGICVVVSSGMISSPFSEALVLAMMSLVGYLIYHSVCPPSVTEVRGKCAVVTGASSGMGVVIAKRLAAEGVRKIVITARREETLLGVAASISTEYPGTEVTPFRSDVANDKDNKELVDFVANKFANYPVILVNNAGVESWVDFEKTSKEKIDQMLDVNLRGLMHLTHDMLPLMKRNGGHIVNIGSIAGKSVLLGTNIYSATKYAVVGFSLALRVDLKLRETGISVHVVCPGFVKEAGMAVNMQEQSGVSMDAVTNVLGYSYPTDTANAVVDAIKFDQPEVMVNSLPVRPLIAIQSVFPRFQETLYSIPLPAIRAMNHWLKSLADAQS